MICFLLTDQEIIAAIQSGVRKPDGRLAIQIPASRVESNAESRPALTFVDKSRTVNCGQISTRLSPIQYSVLRCAYADSRISFESLQDSAWQRRRASDGAIRAVVSKINSRLMEAGFPCELTAYRGYVSLVGIG